MPLHHHPASDERVHTVPGSREDARLYAAPAWHLCADPCPEQAPAADEDPGDGEDGAPTPPEETPA